MLDEFGDVLAGLSFNAPRIPIVSNLTGELAGDELTTPAYWVRHARETVRFGEGVDYLAAAGVRRFLEVGPDPALSAMVRQSLAPGLDQHTLVEPTMRARCSEADALIGCIAKAHTHGAAVHWPALFAGRGARRVRPPDVRVSAHAVLDDARSSSQ